MARRLGGAHVPSTMAMTTDAQTFSHRFDALGSYLSSSEVDELLRVLAVKKIAKGDVLLREGDRSNTAYFLWDGTLTVRVGTGDSVIEIGSCEPGALVGEIAFLDGGPASATVTALSDSVVFMIDRMQLDALRRVHPRIATSVLRALCKSLAARMRGGSAALDRLAGVASISLTDRTGFIDGLRTLFGLTQSGRNDVA